MNKFVLLSFLLLVSQFGFAVQLTIVNDTDSELEIPNDKKCQCRENCNHEILFLDTIKSKETKVVSMTDRQALGLHEYLKDVYPGVNTMANGSEKNKIYLTKYVPSWKFINSQHG